MAPRLLLQANLNHCRAAQDMMSQVLAEWGVGLAVAAEPYRVPDHPHWVGDADGLVATVWGGGDGSPPFSLLERGRGFVAVDWGGVAVVGCYISPRSGHAAFEQYLAEVAACVQRCAARPVLVLGDFNAKSVAWGSPRTSVRGGILGDWAAGLDLRLLNRGSEHTCVRRYGGSIVDVGFATPNAVRMVSGWHVVAGAETLSDHRYIRMEVSAAAGGAPRHHRPGGTPPRRWALRRLDKDALMAAALAATWPQAAAELPGIEEEVARLGGMVADICDAAMPRVGRPSPRRAMYWWSVAIADMRDASVRARRQYTRARRRLRRDDGVARARVDDLYEAYRTARVALQVAIKRAKTQAWRELLQTLDDDPWGRPYRVVLNKLRPRAPPVTEGLDPRLLEDVVNTLFPIGRGVGPRPPAEATAPPEWVAEQGVTQGELAAAIRRLGARNTAPGPDGVPGRVWVLTHGVLGADLRRLFDRCLRDGRFPPSWKVARMVLLRKEGRPAESPSAYRPICLLDEVGKLFERVIAARLVEHLSRGAPGLAVCQYGFRGGRSTVDAISRVRALSESAVSRGGVALAVSLDIANAFNTLPWGEIRRGLEYHRVPPYLRAVVGDYLRGRWIEYPGRDGDMRREVYCGVPQGSVLGPLLWNIAYDAVLRADLPDGVSTVCYADDTLVLAVGAHWGRAKRLAEEGAQRVVGRIRGMGMTVAVHKTEVIGFHSPRQDPPPPLIRVGGADIEVKSQMRYLGLILDSHWRFEEHFRGLVPRLERIVAALGRILPNLGGPAGRVRHLYVAMVRSVALYGAPVWADDLAASRRSMTMLRRVQRRMALRVVRGYRTVSHEAATVLAGMPPLDLLARSHAMMYRHRVDRRAGVGAVPGEQEPAWGDLERQARQFVVLAWQERLALPTAGHRTVGAVRPLLSEWLDRGHGSLTYRMAQVFSGHGSFGRYLCRIGKEPTARCCHCDAEQDTADHTLEVCPAWEGERRVLVGVIGRDVSLPGVVRAILGSERNWRAVASFCESVMLQKEAAGRERELQRRAEARARALARGRRPGARRRGRPPLRGG